MLGEYEVGIKGSGESGGTVSWGRGGFGGVAGQASLSPRGSVSWVVLGDPAGFLILGTSTAPFLFGG